MWGESTQTPDLLATRGARLAEAHGDTHKCAVGQNEGFTGVRGLWWVARDGRSHHTDDRLDGTGLGRGLASLARLVRRTESIKPVVSEAQAGDGVQARLLDLPCISHFREADVVHSRHDRVERALLDNHVATRGASGRLLPRGVAPAGAEPSQSTQPSERQHATI